ncbi:MAG TPA: hypothetical protein VE571_02425 [Solirubrobacteraceae bacterium]|nr:hypothetical protein [Solirubrobacteraceae bacterium]
MPGDASLPTVLIHQDQPADIVGLRLAVASMRLTCPDLVVRVSCPGATPELLRWLSGCGVRADTDPKFAKLGWNVKPKLLLSALDQGHSRVMWLDSDVVVVRRPVAALAQPDSVLVAAEEFSLGQEQGSRLRTQGWGLDLGRVRASTVNSGVLVVSDRHRRLLERWQELLDSDAYVAAQQRPALERPLHMVGDQDVLTALLGSAEFADTQVHLLRRGLDIAQCAGPAGFTPSERLASLGGRSPALYHSVGVKPWQHGAAWRFGTTRRSRARARYEDLHLRLSPYTVVARRFAHAAGLSLDAVAPRNRIERALVRIGNRWPQLPELPLTVIDISVRRLRRLLRISRYARG